MTTTSNTIVLPANDSSANDSTASASDTRELANLTALVQAYATDAALWQPQLKIPDGDRWWTRLHADDQVDVWLLSWLPGHATELHDHGSSSAAFTVVRGLLEELRLTPTQELYRAACGPGTTIWVAPGVIHDVRAVGYEPAVSIHAYSPPLNQMTYYARGLGGAVRAIRTVETGEPEQELER